MSDVPEQCGLQGVQLLTLGDPIGTEMRTDRDAMQFIRDPDHVAQTWISTPFDPASTLPDDARWTGLAYGDHIQVWSAGDIDEAIYVLRGPVIERWPRAAELVACA